jgi:hypothetical protein
MLVCHMTQKRVPNVNYHRTVNRFVSISAIFGICIVVGLNGTLVEAKILTRNT